MTENELVDGLAKGDHESLGQLYRVHKPAFLGFARKNYPVLSEDDAMDAFQDAVVAVCRNFAKGKTLNEDASFQTYLFKIGNYKLLDKIKKGGRQVTFTMHGEIKLQNIEEPESEVSQEEENKEMVRKYLAMMGENCRRIMELFYFDRLNMHEIAEEMGYKNENVAKKTKSNCLEKLRDVIAQSKGDTR
jgi:RNA polymerase sigma factor (sigma-70 family)